MTNPAAPSLPLPLTSADRAYLARVNGATRTRRDAEDRAMRARNMADRFPGDKRMQEVAERLEGEAKALRAG